MSYNKENYEEFLRSKLWKETAARIKRRDKYHCQRCHEYHNCLVVHHYTYKKPNRPDAPSWLPEGWLPEDEYLGTLCCSCHDFLHGHGSDPTTTPSIAELLEMVENLGKPKNRLG